ncbi:hypothetical protein P43SY_012013 [Pythium insidiosum]|uniref:Jacalin-type lectin domain-containing protein n=1 Tax=Pythium insidiosum TaxID=114742 RepID=A0AAD5Q330_PYTIN|nr:hypothetical protein P43SY_012013 [Pythium insidiosum]
MKTDAIVVDADAQRTWKDVVYTQPVALSVSLQGRSPRTVADIEVSYSPLNEHHNWEVHDHDELCYVFCAGECITRVTVFLAEPTPGASSTRGFCGVAIETSLHSGLVVGERTADYQVLEAPTGTMIHTLTVVGRTPRADASLVATLLPAAWLRSQPHAADDSVVCGRLEGPSTGAGVFRVCRHEIAALVFELGADEEFAAIHVLDQSELERVQELQLDASLHLLVLHRGEEITGADVFCHDAAVCSLRVKTSRRQSVWFGKDRSENGHKELSLPGGVGLRVCGFHGTSDGQRVVALGVVSAPTQQSMRSE